jgi:hypothetical protein
MATARRNSSQQKGYLRFKVNYNDAGIATGNKKQTLPAGAIITRTDVLVTTAFNAATTNVLSVGIEPRPSPTSSPRRRLRPAPPA